MPSSNRIPDPIPAVISTNRVSIGDWVFDKDDLECLLVRVLFLLYGTNDPVILAVENPSLTGTVETRRGFFNMLAFFSCAYPCDEEGMEWSGVGVPDFFEVGNEEYLSDLYERVSGIPYTHSI